MSIATTAERTDYDARIALDIAEDIDGSPIPFRSLQDGWDAVGPVVDDVALYPGEQPPF